MIVFVAGATGATGRLLAQILIDRGHTVSTVVRSAQRLPPALVNNPNMSVCEDSLLEMSDSALATRLDGCAAVASCLGHNLTRKGIFGQPRRLVTDATRRLCDAIRGLSPSKPVKFVLMNTTGNSNRDLTERLNVAEKAVIGIIRALVPPHADNEHAADYLRTGVSPGDAAIQWSVVRPDTLVDLSEITPYDIHESPVRSAIFNPGKTSRINVAHFMAELICNDTAWEQWKGRMPVIYNRETNEKGAPKQ